jgi:hypothetical protein
MSNSRIFSVAQARCGGRINRTRRNGDVDGTLVNAECSRVEGRAYMAGWRGLKG